MADSKMKFRISEEKRRLLIVEDEPINMAILSACLEDVYEIVSASTGEEAVEIVKSQFETLSIVLLDLNLPGMSGIDVLRFIKDDVAFSRLPVIVMTADGEAEVNCLDLGAIDFIPKPYPNPEVIRARVRRTVELSEDRDILRFTERDHLTGLYNKEFFFRYAEQLDLFHKDEPTDAIVLDINHFRIINDRFGKARGDEILKHIAVKALEIVEETGGIVCRSEADTFMIYCPHVADYGAVFDSLTRFLKHGGNDDKRVRLRMGVYPEVDKKLDIERRFDCAKMAADSVKDHLNRPIGYYDHSMHDAEVLAEQLIDDFPAAIRKHQFVVYFQPKFNIKGEKTVLASAEALVRWRHPKLGMVSPGVFIPLFESNGLIERLDHYVWAEAAAHIADWKERLGDYVPVSINVSRIDLHDARICERLTDLVRKNGLKESDLLLEITESAYTENSDEIIERIKRLRAHGFKIEMDDFGSGYSSLSMLSFLPIDALKLDMQFIRSAFAGEKDTRLLEAMINLAVSFNVPTIAEGVETAEQVAALKELGCDIIQGYYFSRPLPSDEFERFIKEKGE